VDEGIGVIVGSTFHDAACTLQLQDMYSVCWVGVGALRVQGLGVRVGGLEFRVRVLGFRVLGF
jgi:hypothetical protein